MVTEEEKKLKTKPSSRKINFTTFWTFCPKCRKNNQEVTVIIFKYCCTCCRRIFKLIAVAPQNILPLLTHDVLKEVTVIIFKYIRRRRIFKLIY